MVRHLARGSNCFDCKTYKPSRVYRRSYGRDKGNTRATQTDVISTLTSEIGWSGDVWAIRKLRTSGFSRFKVTIRYCQAGSGAAATSVALG